MTLSCCLRAAGEQVDVGAVAALVEDSIFASRRLGCWGWPVGALMDGGADLLFEVGWDDCVGVAKRPDPQPRNSSTEPNITRATRSQPASLMYFISDSHFETLQRALLRFEHTKDEQPVKRDTGGDHRPLLMARTKRCFSPIRVAVVITPISS